MAWSRSATALLGPFVVSACVAAFSMRVLMWVVVSTWGSALPFLGVRRLLAGFAVISPVRSSQSVNVFIVASFLCSVLFAYPRRCPVHSQLRRFSSFSWFVSVTPVCVRSSWSWFRSCLYARTVFGESARTVFRCLRNLVLACAKCMFLFCTL